MLRFHIVTLFPSFFDSALSAGLMGRALEKGIISVDMTDPREFSMDRHRHVDDRPYGGSPGMVMQIEPVARALRSLASPGRMLAMAPNGRPVHQALCRELAHEEDITLLCGRYEGFDARLYDVFPLEPVSVGDIVLNGGETAALALVEAISRLVPGYMGKEESGEDESFSRGLLEYPHYTRPPVFEGHEVPAVLQQGNHGEIAAWRRKQALMTTYERRPDLLDAADISREDAVLLKELATGGRAARIALCLVDEPRPGRWQRTVHGPVLEMDATALERFAKTLGLASCMTVEASQAQARIKSLAAELERMHGARAKVCAVAPWPKREAALSCRQLGEMTAAGPLILLASRMGYLDKELLSLCDGHVRPLRYLSAGVLGGREYLTMLLDRILGDYM